jgi:aspartate racemase
MYQIGILGGMGPEATKLLFEYIIKLTPAKTDQEHLQIVVLNNPKIKDRTQAIIEKDNSVIEELSKMIDQLKSLNTRYCICPCNTAHFFLRQIPIKGIELIDIIDVTKQYLEQNHQNKNIVILSTEGTKNTKLYSFATNKTSYTTNQNELTAIIAAIKAGEKNSYIRLTKLIKTESDYETKIFVLACTELSIHYEKLRTAGFNVIDPLVIATYVLISKCTNTQK